MNLRVFVLALGTFAIGTGTFVVTGILGGVADDLSVSTAAAGYLVTVFALAYALSSPVLVAATGRVGRRRLLVATLAVFTLANVVCALAPTYASLLGARVVAALCAAIVTPVAGVVAAELADPEHRGRALSIVLGGLSVSWAVGVPLDSVIGDYYGWRASFVLVAVLAAVAAIGVRTLLPAIESPPVEGLVRRLGIVARRGVVLAAVLVTASVVAAGFAVLTYIRPLLESLTALGSGGIGLLLLLFGVASVAGTALGGVFADRFGYGRSAAPSLVILVVTLLSFYLLPGLEAGSLFAVLGTGAALMIWSLVGFALIPLQQYRLIQLAPARSRTRSSP